MAKGHRVFPNLYRDSVSLMQVSAAIAAAPGVEQASAVMASESNLEILRAAGLLDEAGDFGASDLLIVVEGDEAAVAEALASSEALLTHEASPAGGTGPAPTPPRSIAMGLNALPAANLALISTPGDYAAAEAQKALSLGLNVMMFSDNVALADEIALKRAADAGGLMVMGPDCGTAIIDGVPLGFANAVRRGAVGVVAASGTGLQQVTCLVDRWGDGISQAIGTGGRDLKAEVGGATMLRGLSALADDADTRVIVLVSKPPAQAVARRILDAAAKVDKPVVVNFLGADLADNDDAGVYAAPTLDAAAAIAVALAAGGERPAGTGADTPQPPGSAIAGLAPGQRFVRGLFSGGTFCYEALLLLSEALGPVYSNTPIEPDLALADPWRSRENTVVDLGEDVFTRGRPHPMIDGTIRNERIVAEAGDASVAVILLDLVLGHGAHGDPAAEMAPAIRAARQRAADDGRRLAFVASVCGTDADPQGLGRQEAMLREADVLLADSNAAAVRLAARIATRDEAIAATKRAAGRSR